MKVLLTVPARLLECGYASVDLTGGVSVSVIFSIPFSVDDIAKGIPEVDLRGIQLPPPLRDNSSFQFLT